MRIPLHLGNDNSKEAALKIVELHIGMAQLNPRGFRQNTKKSKQTRIERIAVEAFGD